MKHLLEAIVRTNNAKLRIPYLAGLNRIEGGTRIRRSDPAVLALSEMISMELEDIRRDPNSTVADIHPLKRAESTEAFLKLADAVDRAATTNAFGETPTQTTYRWKCANENPATISAHDVYVSERATHNPRAFYAYCPIHGQEEQVSLVEVENEDDIPEPTPLVWAPDERFLIARLPHYIIDWYDARAITLEVGNQGRLLWEERLPYPNPDTGLREHGWYVGMDTGYEIHLPTHIMGAIRT